MIEASISCAKESSLSAPAQNEYAGWIALSQVKGLGGVSFKKLAAHFVDPTWVFSASAEELQQVPGLDKCVVEGLGKFSGWEQIETEVHRLRRGRDTLEAFWWVC